MPRSFWKGSLSFGLVEIPVALYSGTRDQDLSMKLLDRTDFSPVGYKRYNKNTGKEVPWERMVRAYEHEPGEFVVLTDEDLKRANVDATETIEITEFVDAEEIHPVYYVAPYYIEPVKQASKSYALLVETLRRTKKVGVARVVLRTRQHLCALTVRDDVLVLELLRYPYEVRDTEGLKIPEKSAKGAGVTATEVKMAEQLVAAMSGQWDPDRYRDEYREDILALVRKKVKEGTTLTIDESKPERAAKKRTEVVDLMPLLKESIAATRGGGRSGGAEREERRTSRTPRRAASRPSRSRKRA